MIICYCHFAVLWSIIWTVTCGGVCLPVFTFDEDFLPLWYVLSIDRNLDGNFTKGRR